MKKKLQLPGYEELGITQEVAVQIDKLQTTIALLNKTPGLKHRLHLFLVEKDDE
jgi:hypothetical protein